MAPVLNEEAKIGEVFRRVPDLVDEKVMIDDGSTDDSARVAAAQGATILDMGATVGVGAAIRLGYRYAIERGYDVAVIMAGNNKDSPEQIPRLVDPIADDQADLVQGSRYLATQGKYGPMPGYRKLATKAHPLLFSMVAGRRVTDSTNGFRAARTRLLADERLHLDQVWLNEYELEPYLLYKAIKLGYRLVEVPVTKIYPPKSLGQTKMKPITGWWSILRPLVLLGLRIKR